MNREEFRDLVDRERTADRKYKRRVMICTSAGCLSSGAQAVRNAFQSAVKEKNLTDVRVMGTGCLGPCARGPMVKLDPDNVYYAGISADDVPEIVEKHLVGNEPVEARQFASDAPFFSKQHKVVLANAGRIDPERINDYIAAGGYSALLKVISEMSPQQVVDEVTKSGLRGRGGAGFPTGVKWGLVSKASGNQKYVVCNGDEGDPGAFMDRSVMEGDPHRVLEGMAIAGYAVGANQGFLYVRGEYPLAVQRLQTAIRQAERAGLLGARIFDTPFSFRVDIRMGAGAFVCGEETALLTSIEGRRGAPRPRPPYPATSGLWGCPTLINNVETYANISPIILNGGEAYASIGTERSKGTKVFALAGRINNTGLIEVPMGISLREIIFDIGGGIPGGRDFKAVQTGGPSGGYIPAEHLDMPVDYDSLVKVGSIMGSGGMIVMDDRSCMVDVARFFIDFCKDESCGKCVPCRVGTAQILLLLENAVHGEGNAGDEEKLRELADLLRNTSLCALGQTSPNPVLSTLRYFRDEYLAHAVEKRCPAGVCEMHSPNGRVGSAASLQEAGS
jgi:NADH:ubiquinone oxidoreductase subunit F (NADH-binding)